MKRLLALLLMCLTPATYGQVDYTNAISLPETVLNPALNGCAPGVPTCGAWKEGGGWVTGDFQNGVYIFSYQNSALFQDIDLSPFKTNATQFFFAFDLNNSCRNSIGGFCENPFGPIDYIRVKAYAFDINDSLIGEATFMNGNISTANCFLLCESRWERFGYFTSFESQTELSRIRIEFVGGDAGFWGGYYGPLIDNVNASLRYVNDQNWTRLSGEYEQFTIAEDTVVRYGANGTYTALYLTAGTYSCGNGLFGDPIGGVVKSCEIVEPEPTTVNCALDPYNPECIINTLGIDDGTVDYSDPQQVLASLQDETVDPGVDNGIDDGSDDGSNDGSNDGSEIMDEEEVVVAEEAAEEEISLEEMLQEEEAAEEEVMVAEETEETTSEPAAPASVVALADDSKANELADSISKNVLEGALAIAADATAAATSGSAVAATTQTDSSTRSSSLQTSSTAAVVQEAATVEMKEEEQKTEATQTLEAGAEALETGRLIGREALASTMSQTEQSATESVAQAESIAINSSENQSSVTAAAESSQTTVVEEVAVAATNRAEEVVDDGRREVQLVVSEESSSNLTNAEIELQVVTQSDAAIEIDTSTVVENATEQTQDEKTETIALAETQSIEQADSFAEIMQMDIKPIMEENVDADVEFVQQLAATAEQQRQEEVNNSGFSEEEKVTIANDPALANAFNLAPNVTNLEAAGVLGGKQEEKSDAEKRADEVVAANAKEQEEINKNYMDADQSGIVAAMGADTDVGAYRTAMIQDNNIWYKPEDIYKNVVIKDNVRGSYFLEKGNTDTYKKMVEEQYK